MKITIFLIAIFISLSGCAHHDKNTFCSVDSTHNPPVEIEKIQTGMTYQEVVHILGEPDYSPTGAQFYFSTGGQCDMKSAPPASCGFVIDFISSPEQEKMQMRNCSWGRIAE
jgi:hypothetical protein